MKMKELKHRKIPTREEMREMARKILAKEPTGKSPMLPETEEEFNAALRESEEQIKRGEYIDWDIAKEELEKNMVFNEYKRLYRRIVVKNYIILYIVEEKEKAVYVSRMHYGRRNYLDDDRL